MARGTKQRRRQTSSPRTSPPDKDNKRVRVNGTLDGFLALATDSDSESNVSKPLDQGSPTGVPATQSKSSTKTHVAATTSSKKSATKDTSSEDKCEFIEHDISEAPRSRVEHMGKQQQYKASERNTLPTDTDSLIQSPIDNDGNNDSNGRSNTESPGLLDTTLTTEVTSESTESNTYTTQEVNEQSNELPSSAAAETPTLQKLQIPNDQHARDTKVSHDRHNVDEDSDTSSQDTHIMGTTTTMLEAPRRPAQSGRVQHSTRGSRAGGSTMDSVGVTSVNAATKETPTNAFGRVSTTGRATSKLIQGNLKNTPPGISLIPARPYIIRFTLRMHLQPSPQSEHHVITTFKTIFNQLHAIDSSIILYRWADAAVHNANISLAASIPNTITQLRPYCNRLTPKPEGGECFTTIRLGTTLHPDTLREQVGRWMQTNRHGLWPCVLQTESPMCVGWLLYSLRELDLPSLSAAISQAIKVPVGLRWRPINMGRVLNQTKDRTRAIHIDVAKEDQPHAKAALQAIYGTQTKGGFPNGIKMRYVPEIGPHTSPQLRTKIERLQVRQDHFAKNIVRISTWELQGIDHFDANLNATMRDILLQLRSRNHQHLQLFHSVDKIWNGDGYTITALPVVESEARTVVAGLLPFLRAELPLHSMSLAKYFTSAAVERAQLATWDNTTYTLITEDDAIVKDLLEEHDEFDLSTNTAKSVENQSNTTATTALLNWTHPDESDSVSTLQTEANKIMAKASTEDVNVKPQATMPRQGRHSPQGSTISSITLEERMISLESVVTTMINHFRQLMQVPTNDQSMIRWPGQPPNFDSTAGTSPSAGDTP